MDNRFSDLALPTPQVTREEAEGIASDQFGRPGTATVLGSSQEANFRIRTADGDFVLKVANPAFDTAELDLQNQAMEQAATGLPVEVPVPQRAVDGSLRTEAVIAAGPHQVRLLTFVAGEVLSEYGYLAPPVVAEVGALSARMCTALVGLGDPALDRVLQWDPRHSAEVVAGMAPRIADAARRDQLQRLTDSAWRRIAPLAAQLPLQPIHADLADYNVVARRGPDGRPELAGVIDFGDVMRSWRVGDLATAIASLLTRGGRSPIIDVVAAARGFHRVSPLSEIEVEVLWPLVMARAAVLAAGVEVQLAADPGNTYAQAERDSDWAIVAAVASIEPAVVTEQLRAALDLPASAAAMAAAMSVERLRSAAVPPVAAAAAEVVDLSVTATSLSDGAWLTSGVVAVPVAGTVALARHAEPRLIEAAVDRVDPPPTVHLGVDLIVSAGTEVVSPVNAQVGAVDGGLLVLNADGVDVILRGVNPVVAAGSEVTVGQRLGSVAEMDPWEPRLPAHLHLACAVAGVVPPSLVHADVAAAWSALSPDPAPLLDQLLGGTADNGAPEPADRLTRRRDAVVADVQQHYFAAPPRIERGWRQWLIDTDARVHLDMVNNVAVIGHSHPSVTAAASRQFGLLNTNSRFLYSSMVEFGEAIVDLMPVGLDSVFFVNSGSEAVDLALRLVRTATGRRDLIAVRGGYHGWTTATDEISTSLQDNPNARSTRPPWIHLASMPNLYRGEYTGADAADRYAADVAALIDDLVGAGTPPAAFVAEPLSGNAGGVQIPPGYLQQVYASVRAAGGLAVADEVQVGYGRTGDTFWHFEAHDVVPDVVTMAKAVGNGHPVGFVVTRREIAEAFGAEGSFFSSVGGSPVSSAVGMAVLSTLQSEGLQRNAAEVGAHLRTRLLALAQRHSMIGFVHGTGLYLGVELVRDPTTREPATAEAAAICDRLLELGVICQPTGDYVNVLKVKPPLCLTRESADFFVDTLDHVLSTGW